MSFDLLLIFYFGFGQRVKLGFESERFRIAVDFAGENRVALSYMNHDMPASCKCDSLSDLCNVVLLEAKAYQNYGALHLNLNQWVLQLYIYGPYEHILFSQFIV